MLRSAIAALALTATAATDCPGPADDGNPHCWDRRRRCDGPNAHAPGNAGYSPRCGPCEGIGGIPTGDKNDEIEIPTCEVLQAPTSPPRRPEWAIRNGGKFTINGDRFIMIGAKQDPFCFNFFPGPNSHGNLCYRGQTGRLAVDFKDAKALRYDLSIRVPWPSSKHSLFGNITSMILHRKEHMWIVNNLYGAVHQCICVDPREGGKGPASAAIFPVMWNWTHNLQYVGREHMHVEYGVGPMDLEHWTYGPHHAWTAVGDDKIVRMWQPYNGFELFPPGSWRDGEANGDLFEGMFPPPLCRKEGGAVMRIGCTDEGFPAPKAAGRNDVTVDAAGSATVGSSDVKRAHTRLPRPEFRGGGFASMADALNAALQRHPKAKACVEWTAEELQRFQATVLMLRAPHLDGVYQKSADNRRMRRDPHAHGAHWLDLNEAALSEGDVYQRMRRDGHCHEAVMWFVHHLPAETQTAIGIATAIPMLPREKHECPHGAAASPRQKRLCDEYAKQVTCQDCHADGQREPAEFFV